MKISKVVFATHNDGKLKEIQRIFRGVKDLTILSAKEAGVFEEVVENGKTFAANALIKARFISRKTGEWAMADDSGLCVDALGGAPGVLSARWAPDRNLAEFLLSKLRGIPEEQRTAYFKTFAVLLAPHEVREEAFFCKGIVRGKILNEPRGEAHPRLPYDRVFVPDGYNRAFSEMSEDEKNAISHRGQAFAQLKNFLLRMPDL